ncbi:hypothetical protein ACO2Q0_11260 [Phenylobacterium sp. VNQ135]|uniref:hypothetical protein n=1 Tax=Phenylobacterium sp. VNQ135 TaxID=3400922 RepID=UPI003C0D3E1F
MPSYQGKLDGLCGPYAVANALECCGLDLEHERLFRLACAAPARARWPQLLWEGTTFSDVQRMVRSCLDSPANRLGIRARYPFLKSPPMSNADYWRRFHEVFDDQGALCGIIGMTQPWAHWIVVGRDGGRLTFTDSDPRTPHRRRNQASLFAGERRRRPSQWLIDRRELIVFSVG